MQCKNASPEIAFQSDSKNRAARSGLFITGFPNRVRFPENVPSDVEEVVHVRRMTACGGWQYQIARHRIRVCDRCDV